MAIAMASQLIGTDAATGTAPLIGQLTIDNVNGAGNKYDFSGNAIGQDNNGPHQHCRRPSILRLAGRRHWIVERGLRQYRWRSHGEVRAREHQCRKPRWSSGTS